MKHDIDEASLFVQSAVNRIVKSLTLNCFDRKTQTGQSKWRTIGYQELLRYCLEDDDHDNRYRFAAIDYAVGLLEGHLDCYVTHIKSRDLQNTELKNIQEMLQMKNVIKMCREREQEVQEMNNAVFQDLPKKMKI